jgi:hypothetical protein
LELIKLLPDYYDQNETMQELQKTVSYETDQLQENMETTIDQCYAKTADTGLARYEKIYGITTDIKKSYRYRQERLAAKMYGLSATKKQLVEDIATSYTNAAVEVTEKFSEYTVVITFAGTIGIPGNIADIKESIEEVMPAHLAVEYEYLYNTHGSVAAFTHEQLSSYTHYEIRNGRVFGRIQRLQDYQHIELGQLTHIQLTKGDLPNGD